jgi:hypothetical protein
MPPEQEGMTMAKAAKMTMVQAGETYTDAGDRITVAVLVTPPEPGILCLDGEPMVPARPWPCSALGNAPPPDSPALRPGQRYRDPLGRIEVRCLRGGDGQLTFGDAVLTPEAPANGASRRPGRRR